MNTLLSYGYLSMSYKVKQAIHYRKVIETLQPEPLYRQCGQFRHVGDDTTVRLEVEQNQLVAGIEQIGAESSA